METELDQVLLVKHVFHHWSMYSPEYWTHEVALCVCLLSFKLVGRDLLWVPLFTEEEIVKPRTELLGVELFCFLVWGYIPATSFILLPKHNVLVEESILKSAMGCQVYIGFCHFNVNLFLRNCHFVLHILWIMFVSGISDRETILQKTFKLLKSSLEGRENIFQHLRNRLGMSINMHVSS